MAPLNKSKRLLTPTERAAEILFGLIMTLTFTCSISVANAGQVDIRQLLIGAVGCNLAWGIVDAIMFLIGVLAQKSRNKNIFNAVKNLETDKARKYLADALPPIVASVIPAEELDQIRIKLTNLPNSSGHIQLTPRDLLKSIAVFLLIFFSTFTVAVPFVLIHDSILALRVSNLVAIIMMFLCGWSVARYVGFNKWLMGTIMVIIGVLLVFITIALGG
ncbi:MULTISPECIES: VIT1/CCC1 transporter family protein [Niastella]|uniref:VIT1/CCC1 transporter family protein n=1 Tax=Niastella soli TaxID=2821487 RepID=A0ABS3YNE9_9BACT|nr:VIT1/CCC1 transporter family protein [Niastella soli]MBO9199397.1 VIT1/CCC1 transporter family protein [Niastella soli]